MFEPWAVEYVLKPDDFLRIETANVLTGQIEIAYSPGIITVWFSSEKDLTIRNKAGEIIQY